MTISIRMIRALLSAGFLCLSAPALSASTLNFLFDDSIDSTVTPPFVGTGVFDFSIDPGDGPSALPSFGVYSFSFTFGPDTFTTADIITTPGTVLVILSTAGGVRHGKFSNTALFGDGGLGGSIDFVNPNGASLSFEPPAFGGNLDRYKMDSSAANFDGNYAGSSGGAVPEPYAGALIVPALAGLIVWHRRRASAARA